VSAAEITALAVRVPCGFCWAPPGTPCAEQGQHLARYLRAHQRGLISKEVITSACLALPVVSPGQLVAEITGLAGRSAAGEF
jgi:hypothetical protein